MSLKIIKAGIQDTIQDMGRLGSRKLGINTGGAVDKYALQVANMLVGNEPGEAVIEMHFPAMACSFSKPALIALTGADFSASINGEPVPAGHAMIVLKNDVLQFHRPVNGARAYLAVQGGFVLEKWNNSYSTHLKAGAGGFEGRSLRKDDELLFRSSFGKAASTNYTVLPWQADTHCLYEPLTKDIKEHELLVLPGAEWESLEAGSKEWFQQQLFPVKQQSDRMGYRLDGPPLRASVKEELVSSAVDFGTIQLLPDGKLIILAADHQTTGGYPRVAHVISAHHAKLAQCRPGDHISFQLTSHWTAELLLQQQQQHLLQLQNACKFRLEEYVHAH